MTQEELWEWMMEGNYPKGGWEFREHRTASAIITKDIVMSKWQGHHAKPEFIEETIKVGSRVKVVMASRMGDVGITDDLNADHGYHYRIQCVESTFTLGGKPFAMEPELILEDIKKECS